jgi:hypothetical protein
MYVQMRSDCTMLNQECFHERLNEVLTRRHAGSRVLFEATHRREFVKFQKITTVLPAVLALPPRRRGVELHNTMASASRSSIYREGRAQVAA